MRERELIVYRDIEDGGLLRDMSFLAAHRADAAREELRELFCACIHRLLEEAERYGFYGNLWHCHLAHLLACHENSFSRGCELRGEITGSINEAVRHDMEIFGEFYQCGLADLGGWLHAPEYKLAEYYVTDEGQARSYSGQVCGRICGLAKELSQSRGPEEMKRALTDFYRKQGVGKFGLHKAFRVERGEDGVRIEPVLHTDFGRLDDLVGYEGQKKKLTDNTDAFVAGRRANNCLLYGDAGTGKSSCVKAIANEYYGKGLRIIEIYKHQFRDLNEVIGQLRGRNYRFIIYMDDLSFEDFETEYKYLKALIEGGLAGKPENVLIYATSNRRHLIRENYHDREEVREDMHTGDTVQEKLSLAYRFGVTIYFGSPDRKQFQHIVKTLAERDGISLASEELLAAANRWELTHGGLSGRTARQFVDYQFSQPM